MKLASVMCKPMSQLITGLRTLELENGVTQK